MLPDGGADTHHMLMPHSGCIGDDLNAQYEEVRGAMSLSKTEVLTISAPNANPCSTYGINPDLPILQELYNDGDASFVLNMGAMVEPMTKEDYLSGGKQQPNGMYGHFTMQV